MSKTIIRAEHITRKFNDGAGEINIITDLNFSINAGDQLAIVGSSGSGKSTLLQTLGGLDQPNSGKLIINDQDFYQLNENQCAAVRNQYLGFVYQFHHLLPEFTAQENVAMPLLIRGMKRKLALQQAREMLQEVGLDARLTHKPGQLSGGERQRTAIARALVTKPACVLADEPTGNLDPETAAQVYAVMLALYRSQNTALVIVTHDHQLAKQMDQVLELKAGNLGPMASAGVVADACAAPASVG